AVNYTRNDCLIIYKSVGVTFSLEQQEQLHGTNTTRLLLLGAEWLQKCSCSVCCCSDFEANRQRAPTDEHTERGVNHPPAPGGNSYASSSLWSFVEYEEELPLRVSLCVNVLP
uniref:Uncharacterized protein n=1 Tax=Anopheles coluzzii TaxID=1518534 RepID=A0A6E8W3V3_ANOCL